MTEIMENALNHIKTSVDVDPWAVQEVEKVFKAVDDDAISRPGLIKALTEHFMDEQEGLFKGEYWSARSVLDIIDDIPGIKD